MNRHDELVKDRSEDRKLRPLILKALDAHPDCDLSRRLRKEVRRNYDSNTSSHNNRRCFIADAGAWAREHLVEAFDTAIVGVRGDRAFDAFMSVHRHYKTVYGKRLFYQALRSAEFDIQKCDAFGNIGGSGPLVILGVELLP